MEQPPPAPVRASIVSLNGELSGQRFVLRMHQHIGLLYCSDSEIAFPNTKLGVSRRHLRIMFVDGRFVMEDCGSSHGSFCNGERIQSHALAHGDVIGAGQAEFRFELD
jgi:pSer/pThr/pTyr-binding forkhead associated (FHA) protein